MRPDPVFEFWLGLGAVMAVLAAALLFAFPPAWLDGRQDAAADFASLGALAQGANVRENGNVMGTVVAIEARGTLSRVHMKIRKGWRLAPDQGLAVDEANPLQAASLSVARQCRAAPAGEMPAAGCCPQSLTHGGAGPGEMALASCGRMPSLVDVALATTLQARAELTALSAAFRSTVPPLLESTRSAVAATATGMTAMRTASDRVFVVLNDNGDTLKSTLARANATLGNVSNTSRTVDDLLITKREQLDASITNVSEVLATTAATMPGIVADLQKAAEDLRAVTGQVRNEPTQVIRRRERSDPGFVEPAEK